MKKEFSNQGESGFTLIEIAVAIAILGIGMATLLGTTARLMDSTYQEINRAQASIYASYILEVVLAKENQSNRGGMMGQGLNSGGLNSTETNQQNMGNQSGNLVQHLGSLGYFDALPENSELASNAKHWTYEFIRQPLEIPLIPIPPQQILITVRWGSAAHESYTLETIRPPLAENDTSNQTSGGGQNMGGTI